MNKVDWLSQKIVLNEIDRILDAQENKEPGKRLIPVKLDKKRKFNFIKENGEPINDSWYDSIGEFHEGYAIVELNGMYNFIDTQGRLVSKQWFESVKDFHDGCAMVEYINHYKCVNFINTKGEFICDKSLPYGSGEFNSGRALVMDGDYEHFHFIDQNGNRIGEENYCNTYCDGFYPDYGFVDGFAVVSKNKYSNIWFLIDKNGKEVPQDDDDTVYPYHNCGYGYYFAGKRSKIRGIKLKDANTDVVIDYYNETYSKHDFIDNIHRKIVQKTSKRMPALSFRDRKKDDHTVEKRDGILYIGNYWFIGPSNLSLVEKTGLVYYSLSPYGTFKTKIPPIRAIDSRYIICANNDKMYLYDAIDNKYTLTCTRKDVEDHMKERKEKKTYNKISESFKAIKALNEKGVSAKVVVNAKNDFTRDTEDRKGYELQPAYLSVPGIIDYIYIKDADKIETIWNGQRVSLKTAYIIMTETPRYRELHYPDSEEQDYYRRY